MLPSTELKRIARHRLIDSNILLRNKRFDGAIYLCGYAIEAMLKQKICMLLNWNEFPCTRNEFKELNSFKTHNLDVLLKLSGNELKIKNNFLTDWSIVSKWNSEIRYNIIGTAKLKEAEEMIKSARIIIKNL